MFKHKELKQKQRVARAVFSSSLALRTHRALSWLNRAEQETQDDDARFLFLWIAFNAAYANEFHDRKIVTDRKMLLQFLDRLVESDGESLLHEIVWNQFSSSIRVLIDNKFVFQPFWDCQAGLISDDAWKESFEKSKISANKALGKTDTTQVLAVIFDRLYTLRNQIVHGGATWNSGVNRAQMKDGANILGYLIPTVIHLMMENHNQLWGDACYPVVD
ncbi:hypothetical protein ACFL1C_08425 [Pseudomonadota bacterium]